MEISIRKLLSNALSTNNVSIAADNITLAENYSDSHATTLTLNATSVITLTGSFNRAGTIVANAGTTLTGAGGLACGVACTVSIGADSTTYTGVVNTPSFTKQGSGTLTLSGSNTIGATTVVSGGIKVGHGSGLGAGAVSVQPGAFVDLNGNTVSNSFELAGIGPGGANALQNTNTGTAAFVNGGAITLKQVNDNDASVKIGHNGDIFISGSITDASGNVAAGRLVKGGAGTLFLEAANSYTGGTEIYNGAIRAYNLGALGSNGNIEFTGGTLGIHVNNFALDAARMNNQNNVNIEVGPDANSQGVNFALSGASSFGGTISLASGSTMALQPSGSIQYAGNISGAGAVAITGSNATDRFVFGGNATHTGGTSVTNAILQIGDGTGNTFRDYSGALSLAANSTLELNPGTSGTITTNITSAGTIKNISSQDVTFSNISSHSGPTSVASNGSITFNVASGTLALTGNITGDGRIVKTGSGQLNLEGTNTFTGGLRIADGNVQLGSSPLPTTGTTLQLGGSAVLKVSSATPDYSGIMTFDSTSSYLRISVPAGALIRWQALLLRKRVEFYPKEEMENLS